MKQITEDEFPFFDNPFSQDEFIERPEKIGPDDLRDPEINPFTPDENLNYFPSEDPLLNN